MTNAVDVRVPPEFWASSIMPGGVIEKWIQPNGSDVEAGEPVAAIRVESVLHHLLAPCAGRLEATCNVNSVIDPGFVIGQIVPRQET
jgi:hypothetical protein